MRYSHYRNFYGTYFNPVSLILALGVAVIVFASSTSEAQSPRKEGANDQLLAQLVQLEKATLVALSEASSVTEEVARGLSTPDISPRQDDVEENIEELKLDLTDPYEYEEESLVFTNDRIRKMIILPIELGGSTRKSDLGNGAAISTTAPTR